MSQSNPLLPKKAVILAAGRGKRLRPYTDVTPKPLLEQNGRAAIDTTLASLKHAGVSEVAIVIHHLGEQIQAFVGDGSHWGQTVTFFHQPTMGGTGDAVKTAVSFITEPTFIIAADYYLPLDYCRQLKSHYLQTKADMAISLKKMSLEEITKRSSVRFGQSGWIEEIVEKPEVDQAPSQMAGSLIIIVPAQITTFLTHLNPTARHELEIQDAINAMLREGFTMCGLQQSPPVEWQRA